MRNGKHGRKALVLGVMVVMGALAFAAGAQAQTHPELLSAHLAHNQAGGTLNPNPLIHGSGSTIGEYLVNLGPALLATFTAALDGNAVLLVAGRSEEARCTGLTFNGAKIDTLTDALGEAVFTGCKKFDHKALTELPTCLLKELETIRIKFLMLPILHGGEAFLLFEPLDGISFGTISLKPGIGCTLPLNNPLTGSFTALVEELDAVTQTLLFSEGIQLLTGDLLAFGGFQAYLKATVLLALSGAHLGQKFGIH